VYSFYAHGAKELIKHKFLCSNELKRYTTKIN